MYKLYLLCPYVEGARGPFEFDCWGLVRELLRTISKVPEKHIPEFGGITRSNGMHEAFESVQEGFVKVDDPEEGAVICVFTGDHLTHIGYYIDGNVLHTNKVGPRHVPLEKFKRYGRLEYYVYR